MAPLRVLCIALAVLLLVSSCDAGTKHSKRHSKKHYEHESGLLLPVIGNVSVQEFSFDHLESLIPGGAKALNSGNAVLPKRSLMGGGYGGGGGGGGGGGSYHPKPLTCSPPPLGSNIWSWPSQTMANPPTYCPYRKNKPCGCRGSWNAAPDILVVPPQYPDIVLTWSKIINYCAVWTAATFSSDLNKGWLFEFWYCPPSNCWPKYVCLADDGAIGTGKNVPLYPYWGN